MSGLTPSPPPAPWPALSPSSPTAQGHLGAQRRRPSRWSFSWLDKTTGQWKCPLCKWVSRSSDRAPSTAQLGQCSLPDTPWEDRTGLLLLERAGPPGPFQSQATGSLPQGGLVLRIQFHSASVYEHLPRTRRFRVLILVIPPVYISHYPLWCAFTYVISFGPFEGPNNPFEARQGWR